MAFFSNNTEDKKNIFLKKMLDNRPFWTAATLLCDALSLFAALVTSYGLRQISGIELLLGHLQPFEFYAGLVPMSVILGLMAFSYFGLYKRTLLSRGEEFWYICKTATAWVVVIIALSFLFKHDYSRLVVLASGVFLILYATFGRFFIRRVKSHLHKKGIALTNILIVGNGDLKQRMVERLQSLAPYGVRIINKQYSVTGEISLTTLLNGSLKHQIISYPVHELFIIEPRATCDEILEFISGYQNQKIKFRILADIFRLISPSLDDEELDQIPTLGFHEAKPYTAHVISKRIADIVLVLLVLPIALPLFTIIAILIKLDSRGPVFIKQQRVGRNKKNFTLYKFRTMHCETKLYEYAPLTKNDTRVTKVGKLLRRISFDELPQIVNILIGNMSFVGPRPEMPFIVSSYKPWQEKRLLVKPGLTGLWQILGRKNIPLHENLQLDFYYINNQSIYLDLNILLKTIPAVAFGRGAY